MISNKCLRNLLACQQFVNYYHFRRNPSPRKHLRMRHCWGIMTLSSNKLQMPSSVGMKVMNWALENVPAVVRASNVRILLCPASFRQRSSILWRKKPNGLHFDNEPIGSADDVIFTNITISWFLFTFILMDWYLCFQNLYET